MNKKSGITLIELAVVLTIIGLIAGGALAGKAMLENAYIARSVKQIEQYRAALTLFETKYQMVPGDLTQEQATRYNYLPAGRTDSTDYYRHGDGLISTPDSACTTECAPVLGSENLLFWRDLFSANMIAEPFNTVADDATYSDTIQNLDKYIPRMPISASFLIPYSTVSNLNGAITGNSNVAAGTFFHMGAVTSITNGSATLLGGMTDVQARDIDFKIDDGKPFLGNVLAATSGTLSPEYASATCVTPTGSMDYMDYIYKTQAGNTPACALSIRLH